MASRTPHTLATLLALFLVIDVRCQSKPYESETEDVISKYIIPTHTTEVPQSVYRMLANNIAEKIITEPLNNLLSHVPSLSGLYTTPKLTTPVESTPRETTLRETSPRIPVSSPTTPPTPATLASESASTSSSSRTKETTRSSLSAQDYTAKLNKELAEQVIQRQDGLRDDEIRMQALLEAEMRRKHKKHNTTVLNENHVLNQSSNEAKNPVKKSRSRVSESGPQTAPPDRSATGLPLYNTRVQTPRFIGRYDTTEELLNLLDFPLNKQKDNKFDHVFNGTIRSTESTTKKGKQTPEHRGRWSNILSGMTNFFESTWRSFLKGF